jgi:hypothetical protein
VAGRKLLCVMVVFVPSVFSISINAELTLDDALTYDAKLSKQVGLNRTQLRTNNIEQDICGK